MRAESAVERAAVPPSADAQLFPRQQTILDNQLFKEIATLREAQKNRIEAIEPLKDAAD